MTGVHHPATVMRSARQLDSAQYVVRRTEQSDAENGVSQVYQVDQRLLKEDREPRTRGGLALHVLQLVPGPEEPKGHNSHRRGVDG